MAGAKSLTSAELEKVLVHIHKHSFAERNRVMLLMTVLAGMRVGEVAALTIGDVRAADGLVQSEIFLSAERAKHGHARTIYINSRLREELEAYVRSRRWYEASQPLFNTQRGTRRGFSPNTLAQHFHYLYKRAGVKGASSHSGRKTFLTSLASQGVSVFVLASLAGHKNIATTQRYVTVHEDMKRKAVELV